MPNFRAVVFTEGDIAFSPGLRVCALPWVTDVLTRTTPYGVVSERATFPKGYLASIISPKRI